MRTPRDRRERTPVEWYPPMHACPAGHQPVLERSQKPRWVMPRDPHVNVVRHVLACGHTHGERRAAVSRPDPADTWAWRGDTCGLEVVARRGARRSRDHRAITTIRDPLQSASTCSISVNAVAWLGEVLLALVTPVARRDPARSEPWRRWGGIVLAMAGGQPEQRPEPLDMVSDVRSGRVFGAKTWRSSAPPERAPGMAEGRG